jgi:cytochrome b6-f complex iron-sulfur subunit
MSATQTAGTPQPVDAGRRRALTLTSVLGLLGAGFVAGFSNLLFFRPRVTYGEPSRFRIGRPESFPPGTRLPLGAKRVTVIRTAAGVAAVSTTCTHLGCVVATTEVGFDCPCHGSRFDPDGGVLGGPAPRPLPWFQVALTPSGEVEVDTAVEVPAGSFLKV